MNQPADKTYNSLVTQKASSRARHLSQSARKFLPPSWTVEQLRWYKQIPGYNLIPWWNRLNPKPAEPLIDTGNKLLCYHTRAGRPEVRIEPYLWEVLRRHPDFGPLYRKHRHFYLLYPQYLTHREFELFENTLLSPWNNQGRAVISDLLYHGAAPWQERAQSGFGTCLPEFLSACHRFPLGKRLRGRPTVEVVRMPHVANNQPGFDPRREDQYTVAEYREKAHKKGRRLLMVEFDQDASSEQVAEGVRELFARSMRLHPGEPSRTPTKPGQNGYIKIRPDRLELLALLDSGSAIPSSKLKAMNELFAAICLSPCPQV